MDKKALYSLKDVSYSYLGRFGALNDISVSIEESERVALLGANGSGKSTLLLLLAGLAFPDKGNISFDGQMLREESFVSAAFQRSFRSRVGVVFQNSDIQLFNTSVEEEVLFGLRQLGIAGSDAAARKRSALELMAIGHLAGRHPQNLSIGEKKRVAIASVLAMEPEILLFDEPTAGLDPRTARHLIDAINAFSAKGRTVITATQDIHIVSEIADRIIVLGEDKTVVRDGPAEELLADAAFLEAQNLVHVHAHEHKGAVHVHPHEHPSHDHEHK